MSFLSSLLPGISFNRSLDRSNRLDAIFQCLSDPTRRDILHRLARNALAVGEVAAPYSMSLAAVSKHLKILESAKLVIKKRLGKQQVVMISPTALKEASTYLRQYEQLWNERLDRLEQYLSTFPSSHGRKR